MMIYLMRHGPAVRPPDSAYSTDRERPLTPRGRTKTMQAARGMRRLGIVPDRMLFSPLVRARQTAEIVQRELDLESSIVSPTEHLEPGFDADRLLDEIAALEAKDSVLLIGHEPDLSRFAARLIAPGHHMGLMFRKGCLCGIEVPSVPDRGTLVFLLQPKHLRAAR